MLEISSVFSYTHPGKVRAANQDTIYCDPEHRFWLLADGMGGHSGGELASQTVINTLKDNLPNTSIEESIRKAQHAVRTLQSSDKELAKMGTTLVLVLATEWGFNLAWIGDSRIYRYESSLKQLTHDHSFVQHLIDRGLLSAQRARGHEKRNVITRFIGVDGDMSEADYAQYNPYRRGTLLLCSDGVSDFVTERQISDAMRASENNEKRAEHLVATTFDTEASDNVSFILISYTVSLGLKITNYIR